MTLTPRSLGGNPPLHAAGIVPDDAADITVGGAGVIVRGISVNQDGMVRFAPAGNDGDVSVTMLMLAGVIHPRPARRIYATGTTATGIVGHW